MTLPEALQLAAQSLAHLAELEAARKQREAEARERRWQRNGWGAPPAESEEEE